MTQLVEFKNLDDTPVDMILEKDGVTTKKQLLKGFSEIHSVHSNSREFTVTIRTRDK